MDTQQRKREDVDELDEASNKKSKASSSPEVPVRVQYPLKVDGICNIDFLSHLEKFMYFLNLSIEWNSENEDERKDIRQKHWDDFMRKYEISSLLLLYIIVTAAFCHKRKEMIPRVPLSFLTCKTSNKLTVQDLEDALKLIPRPVVKLCNDPTDKVRGFVVANFLKFCSVRCICETNVDRDAKTYMDELYYYMRYLGTYSSPTPYCFCVLWNDIRHVNPSKYFQGIRVDTGAREVQFVFGEDPVSDDSCSYIIGNKENLLYVVYMIKSWKGAIFTTIHFFDSTKAIHFLFVTCLLIHNCRE